MEKEENKSAAAYDEVGIECNDKSERVVLANCPRIVRLLWAKLKWEEDPDMPSDLTLAEQSERRRKEYLDVGDPKTRRRKRREEQVREVERVLLKYVLSYDEEGRKDWSVRGVDGDSGSDRREGSAGNGSQSEEEGAKRDF